MIHSVKFTCVLDTNVIYPIEIRDLLFWFAHFELYTPKWSTHIFDEWKDLMTRKGVTAEEIINRVEKANKAFPDALVKDYETLIGFLSLPDSKDRHVLAAAIKANANVIVTNNLRDFPEEVLEPYGITAKSVDGFLTDLIDLNPQRAIEAFRRLVMNRRNPDLDEYQVLDAFRRNGLKDTADYLHALL